MTDVNQSPDVSPPDDAQPDTASAIIVLDTPNDDDDDSSGRGWHPLSQLPFAPHRTSVR